MAEVLVSPGIQITETDKSYVPARPLIAGAAIIGPTAKGPANSPTVVTSYGDYQRKFGTTFMMNRYEKKTTETDKYVEAEDGEYIKNENGEYVIPENYSDSDVRYAKTTETSDELIKLQQKKQEYLTSMAAKSFFEQGGESLLVVRVTDNDFKSGRAVIPAKNDETAFEIKTISQGEDLNNWSGSFQDRSETTASIDGVIRTDGSLISGSKDNIRWEIADVDEETGTFSIYVRRGDDVDYDKNILEAFTGLNLDPDSENYISRRIGDQYQELVEEVVGDSTIYYIRPYGNYPNISNYIYIKDVNPIYGYFLADGYTRRGKDTEDDVANMLPKQVEGGFAQAEGKLFTNEEDEANALFFEDITNGHAGAVGGYTSENKIQGINPEKYQPLIACLENTDEYEINMISVPGLTVANNTTEVDMVNSLASKRGDLIAVVDLVGFGSPIGDVQQKALGLNSSYSAAYWPWLQMYSSTGRLEWVPASVIIPGVYTYTDHVAAPWYAPAGMTRGSVQGVIQTERKLLKQHRDELYKKNVNPISILPGNGITVYGQKTLQKKATALDRVNVRRLLIELKRTVKNMASGLLFEFNDAQLRSTFKSNLDAYLESVTKRRGLYSYKTVVEELNTSDVIDRNELRCQIYIQPTKVVEFIYIDFTITNTGVDFNTLSTS